jgi:integrase
VVKGIGELCNLKTGDIFFKELGIRITKGKGGQARKVPFQQTYGKIIRKYLDIRGDLALSARSSPSFLKFIRKNWRHLPYSRTVFVPQFFQFYLRSH